MKSIKFSQVNKKFKICTLFGHYSSSITIKGPKTKLFFSLVVFEGEKVGKKKSLFIKHKDFFKNIKYKLTPQRVTIWPSVLI